MCNKRTVQSTLLGHKVASFLHWLSALPPKNWTSLDRCSTHKLENIKQHVFLWCGALLYWHLYRFSLWSVVIWQKWWHLQLGKWIVVLLLLALFRVKIRNISISLTFLSSSLQKWVLTKPTQFGVFLTVKLVISKFASISKGESSWGQVPFKKIFFFQKLCLHSLTVCISQPQRGKFSC